MKKHNPYEDTSKNFEQADKNISEAEMESEGGEDAQIDDMAMCPRCERTETAAVRMMAEAEDLRLRALAEADNLRKRMQREKDEAIRYSASAVLSDILPALDNLDLALEHAKDNDACKNFFVGVDMTKKLLLESLKKHGLEPVGAVGEEFDPALHEALSMMENPDLPNGAICTVFTRGYKLHDRLLRPAKVVVCKK